MMDLLPVWQSEWALIPLDSTGTMFPMNLASYISSRVTGKLSIAPPDGGSAVFTFAQGAFSAAIAGLQPSSSSSSNIQSMASAWQSAILASTFIVSTAYIGAPTPATLFAAPPTAVPIPAAGAAVITSTLGAGAIASLASESAMPIALYNAFAALQYTLSGMNMIVPTPTPLVGAVGVA